jgi:ribonucleoside-diphosphate reductase alpha chain
MPREATVDDIKEAYLEGWNLGLKALAIYRDGSKESQPVSTSVGQASAISADLSKAQADLAKVQAELAAAHSALAAAAKPAPAVPAVVAPAAPAPAGPPQPRRERLPNTRHSMTHKFDIQGHEGYLTVGFFDDGRPGELFITMAKEGSTVGGLMDVVGTLVSMGLQYGVPLDVFVNKFAHSRFEPAGFTRNPDIPIAKSITDYIFRWMGIEFIAGYREANTPAREVPSEPEPPKAVVKTNGHRTATIKDLEEQEALASHSPAEPAAPAPTPGLEVVSVAAQQDQFARFQSDAPACDSCGALTVRCGTCYRCFNCGNSMGCS